MVDPRRSYVNDPMWVVSALRYRDKPWGLSYDLLRLMAVRDPVVAAILQTRGMQVASLRKPSRYTRDGAGFVVRHRDPKHTLTKVEEKRATDLEDFFVNCGVTRNKPDKLGIVLKKLIRDRLTLDQTCIEVVRDRKGRPADFYAVDGASMRLVVDAGTDTTQGFMQLVGGLPAVEFTPDELIFAVSNPRTDIRIAGYGFPELEMLINVVTAHLFAEDYNKRDRKSVV